SPPDGQAKLSAQDLQLGAPEFGRPDAANRSNPNHIELEPPEQQRSQPGTRRTRAGWSLPPALMHLVRLQGEPSQQLFQTLVTEALRLSVDEDNIIKACLDSAPPYGGSIYQHVQSCGGEDYVKRVITSTVNATPQRAEREEIHVARVGTGTDTLWR